MNLVDRSAIRLNPSLHMSGPNKHASNVGQRVRRRHLVLYLQYVLKYDDRLVGPALATSHTQPDL